MIWNVILHRLLLFKRKNVDWVSRLLPLAFTAFFCFVSYAIFTSLIDGLRDDSDEVKAEALAKKAEALAEEAENDQKRQL